MLKRRGGEEREGRGGGGGGGRVSQDTSGCDSVSACFRCYGVSVRYCVAVCVIRFQTTKNERQRSVSL